MASLNDLVFLSYRIGRSISEPGSNVRYEIVSPMVRVTSSPDFNAPPARFHIRVLRNTPEGTVMSVFGSRNREWDALVARAAYLIRSLEAQVAPTTSATTPTTEAVVPATATTAATVAAQDSAQASALVDAVVKSVEAEDEDMDMDMDMDVKTVSRSASGAGAEGIMDKPWFWPAVAVGGVAAFMYLRRK